MRTQNECAMIDHVRSMREKSYRTAAILDNEASNTKIELAAFTSNVELRLTTKTLCDNVIHNRKDKLRLDSKLLVLKIPIGDLYMRNS